jgi:hypothetical protein
MKILATFLILLSLSSLTINKKSMKSNSEKSEKSTVATNNKSEIKKGDPGAILPEVAVNYYIKINKILAF